MAAVNLQQFGFAVRSPALPQTAGVVLAAFPSSQSAARETFKVEEKPVSADESVNSTSGSSGEEVRASGFGVLLKDTPAGGAHLAGLLAAAAPMTSSSGLRSCG